MGEKERCKKRQIKRERERDKQKILTFFAAYKITRYSMAQPK